MPGMEKKHKSTSTKNISIREYLTIHGKIVKENPPIGGSSDHTCSSRSERCEDSFKQPTLNHFISKMKKRRRRATTPAKTGVPVSLVTRGVRKKASSDGRPSSQVQDNKNTQCPRGASEVPSNSGVLCAVDPNVQPHPMACGIDIKLSKISHRDADEVIDDWQNPFSGALEQDQQPKARISDHTTTCMRTDKENYRQCVFPEAVSQDCAKGTPKTVHKDRGVVSGPYGKPLDSVVSSRGSAKGSVHDTIDSRRRSKLKLNRRPKATRARHIPSSRPEATAVPVIDENLRNNTKLKIKSKIPCNSSSGSKGGREGVDSVSLPSTLTSSLPPPKQHTTSSKRHTSALLSSEQHTSSPLPLPKDGKVNYTDTEELLAELSYCEKIKI